MRGKHNWLLLLISIYIYIYEILLLQFKVTVFYFNFYLFWNVIYSCDAKSWLFSMQRLHQSSVSHDPSEIFYYYYFFNYYYFIYAFNISYYYQRWKQWCLLFVETIMFFGQDSFIIRKFHLKIKFKIEIFCNKYFTVTFASLLNISINF